MWHQTAPLPLFFCTRAKSARYARIPSMALWPLVGQDLGDSRLAERLKGLFLTVVNIKNGEQFRDLQQVSYLPSQVGQLDAGASMSRRSIDFHQRSQSATIYVADGTQIDHNPLLARGYQVLHLLAQCCRFITEDNATAAFEDRNAFRCANIDFQLHCLLREIHLVKRSPRGAVLQGPRPHSDDPKEAEHVT